jgi:hypothetical protein
MLTKKSSSVAPTKQRTSKNTSKSGKQKPKQSTQNNTRTRILVRYDVGFNNALYIRGKGLNHLNWDRGLPLKNLKADVWIWETDAKFNDCEFKILINDRNFEVGPNHNLKHGNEIEFTPNF